MIFRVLLLLSATLSAAVAVAQTTPVEHARPSDRWDSTPAAAASTGYRADRKLPGSDSHSPFQFKQPARRGPAYAPPPQANDKAAVMGKQRPWQNGRPPVDCAMEPRDPACQ